MSDDAIAVLKDIRFLLYAFLIPFGLYGLVQIWPFMLLVGLVLVGVLGVPVLLIVTCIGLGNLLSRTGLPERLWGPVAVGVWLLLIAGFAIATHL